MNQRWNPTRYARTAEYLFPASQVAVAALELCEGAVLLDSATGTGNAAAVALAHRARVVGVDSSPEQIGEARDRLPTANFVVADAEDLPFPTASFDAGVSVFGVIFANDSIRALSELVRCVRHGGQVAFTTLSENGWPSKARVILADELDAPPPFFPSRWSSAEAAGQAAAHSGLETIVVRTHTLRLLLDSQRSLADQVTERMGALAAMRTQLEAQDRWHRARARLDEYLNVCAHFDTNGPTLSDPYIVATGHKART
ncbi:methyltransferase domain-containing protein [Nocardia cyriacigeorgica]|uniref:Methyltransferase domain-containing protein n=1 Tax=Nocardia cyriacigeorgica TaxID=135487 RepID=A0A6P1DB10_9NOCA|nr:class I SAM-dependent methyltransferase [Nocardia cyriacigeorgica]NEW37872.1 methyltransferase domain-containing protein [Nocardia cyriacigeorgica]NEW47935.1 methyltransferase domain-containing protein [Nocardia cyriacigeorgica]NEW48744.1 methyltransferase domain-containing protein [Nocardia cyriacigeorgica]NEW58245.1 methyltransferase domain-containing protein [Nocardia cyriacigeorgica]